MKRVILLSVLLPSVAAAQSSTLGIESVPQGAHVYVDGVHRGTTPLLLGDLSEDQHRVELFMHGWRDATRFVRVEQSVPKRIIVPLDRPLSRRAWFWPTVIGSVVLFLGTCAFGTVLVLGQVIKGSG